MQTYIKQGFGFTVGYDFARAKTDTPFEIDRGAFPKAGYLFGWIAGEPASALGFLRGDREGKVRVCVRQDGVSDRAAEAEAIVAVNKAIAASRPKIGKAEARKIHALLAPRSWER